MMHAGQSRRRRRRVVRVIIIIIIIIIDGGETTTGARHEVVRSSLALPAPVDLESPPWRSG
jgi:hypothetical protein